MVLKAKLSWFKAILVLFNWENKNVSLPLNCFFFNLCCMCWLCSSWVLPLGSSCLPSWCLMWTTWTSWLTTSASCSTSQQEWRRYSSSLLSSVRSVMSKLVFSYLLPVLSSHADGAGYLQIKPKLSAWLDTVTCFLQFQQFFNLHKM